MATVRQALVQLVCDVAAQLLDQALGCRLVLGRLVQPMLQPADRRLLLASCSPSGLCFPSSNTSFFR